MPQVSPAIAGDFSGAQVSRLPQAQISLPTLSETEAQRVYFPRVATPSAERGSLPCVSDFLIVKKLQDHKGHLSGKEQEIWSQAGLFPSPSYTIFQLYELGQVSYLLWASVSSCGKRGCQKGFAITHGNPSDIVIVTTIRVIISEMDSHLSQTLHCHMHSVRLMEFIFLFWGWREDSERLGLRKTDFFVSFLFFLILQSQTGLFLVFSGPRMECKSHRDWEMIFLLEGQSS